MADGIENGGTEAPEINEELVKLQEQIKKLQKENGDYKSKEKARMTEEEQRAAEAEERAKEFEQLKQELNRSKSEKVFSSKGYDEKQYAPIVDALIANYQGEDISSITEKICTLIEATKTAAVEAYKTNSLKNKTLYPQGGKSDKESSFAERLAAKNKTSFDESKILEYYNK